MIRGFAALILERKLQKSSLIKLESIATQVRHILNLPRDPPQDVILFNVIRDIIEDKRATLWGMNGITGKWHRYGPRIYQFKKEVLSL